MVWTWCGQPNAEREDHRDVFGGRLGWPLQAVRDTIVLNTAASLWWPGTQRTAFSTGDITACHARDATGSDAIDSGAVSRLLDRWAAVSSGQQETARG